MESEAGSGNLRGSLVVSMSNARTTGSWVWKHGNGGMEYGGMAHRTIRFVVHKPDLGRVGAAPPDAVPVADVYLAVDGHPHVVWDIMLSGVHDIVQLTGRLDLPCLIPTPGLEKKQIFRNYFRSKISKMKEFGRAICKNY